MADLPNIDTSQVGYLAYWNIDSDGNVNLDNFDPEDALSAARLDNYTTYDNGWEGEIYLNSINQNQGNWDRPLAKIRVKTDGWFVCYIDRTNNFERDKEDTGGEMSNFKGYWKLHDSFQCEEGPVSVDKHGFAEAINHIQSELPNTVSWSFSDVGVYNYEHSSATNSTGMSGHGGESGNVNLVVASGTTVAYAAVTGTVDRDGTSNQVDWENTVLAAPTGSNDPRHGTYDPGSLTEGTEYGHNTYNPKRCEIYTATFIWS